MLQPEMERGRPEAASTSPTAIKNIDRIPHRGIGSTARLVPDLDHFRRRVLEDALNEACSAYWLRRADDFNVVGTPECDEIAKACRHRAQLALIGGTWPEIHDVLSEDGVG